ncbi:MAG: MBL fold metallo-hydrolase [Pseudomonadota bacterium]
MKNLRWIGAAVLLMATPLFAGNLTEKSVDKARAVLDRAMTAYGGTERVNGIKTIAVQFEDTNFGVGQSRGTAKPWDKSYTKGQSFVDLENNIFANRVYGDGGGFEFANGTVVNGDDSVQINFRAESITPIAEPDFATTSGPFMRVTPVLLLRQFAEHSRTAHHLGIVDYNDRPHDVVSFSMTVGPAISLYVDEESGLINRSERVFPGFGLVEYHFSDYEDVDGIPCHKNFELRLNGDTNLIRKNLKVAFDADAEPFLKTNAAFARNPANSPDTFQRQELADGVWFIGGNGTYAMFVEMDDYILAVGGTAAVAASMSSLREVTEKRIRYGVLTHQHSDHVLGVPTYVAEGATVVASTAHEQVVRDAAPEGSDLALELVGEKRVFDDGRRVELIDVGPTAHTEHLLVAWLPDERILFEADHFAMPRVGPIPPAVASTRSFSKALASAKLKPARIASAHSPVLGTPEDLERSVKTKSRGDKAPMIDF